MRLTLPIREVIPATPRARVVRLDLGGRRFSYRAGQAVSVAAPGTDRWKAYSIAAAPEDAERDGWIELLVGVDGNGRPASPLTLPSGNAVELEGPIGRFTFPDDPEERRFVFIAGGIGIAPLRAMLRHALSVPHQTIGLLYSARTTGDFAYEDELRSLAREQRIALRQTVTRDLGPDGWVGTRGRISASDLAPLVPDPATLCFICGPPALVDEIPRLLEDLGVASGRIRVEEP